MKIVDDRNMENELSTFRNIPNLCVFEFPDIGVCISSSMKMRFMN